MKYCLGLIFLFSVEITSAQDTLSIKEIYFENDLAHKISNDEVFNGVAQELRRNGNGHIVSEEIYENGILLEWKSYFGKSNRRLAEKVFYYKDYPLAPKQRLRYISNKKGFFIEQTDYDLNFKKTLFTRFQDSSIVYKCSYKEGKKDGLETCYDNDGNLIITKFVNGKKAKN